MNHLQEMLKQKEQELGRLQKEIEALRLVVELVAEGHSKVIESEGGLRKSPAQMVAGMPAETAVRNAPVAPAAMSAAATVANGGAKRFP